MLSLRSKVQAIRKMNNLETEIQDVSPDEHQGLQVERWVQTVRNLSKTLVYAAEEEANVKITSESTLYLRYCPRSVTVGYWFSYKWIPKKSTTVSRDSRFQAWPPKMQFLGFFAFVMRYELRQCMLAR